MQSIKQFRDRPPVCGLYDLSLYLYDRFEALIDEHLSIGCTCPQFAPS